MNAKSALDYDAVATMLNCNM